MLFKWIKFYFKLIK
jgi:hypothetical protein